MADRPPAWLVLTDGTVMEGRSIGAPGETWGEVVFNTSMAGYQEILTDPSYRGQIVTLTYPLIGNYGIVPEDAESWRPWAEGLVIRELSPIASNYRSRETLEEYLTRNDIVGIEGLDTRAVTRRLRTEGAMTGMITTQPLARDALVERVRSFPVLEGRDLVLDVTRSEPEVWERGWDAEFRPVLAHHASGGGSPRVAVLDYGVKRNILRSLVDSGFHVTVFPARTTAEEILACGPHGVLLSNGPGDPRVLDYAAECARGLIGRVPVFGICLGHQIMAKAIGAELYKLKFGHHGANHPVRDVRTGRVRGRRSEPPGGRRRGHAREPQ